MFKKILAGLLAVMMVISILNVSAFAASLNLQADKVEIQEGETSAVVAVNLSGNPGIATIGFDVTYDSNAMTLKSVDCGDVVTAAEITAGDLNKNPYTVSIPYTTDAVDKLADNTNNGTLVYLNFEINADCTPGEYEISLSEGTLGGALNMSEEWVDISISNGSITVVGKTTTPTTESTTESTTITTTESTTETTTITTIETTTESTTKGTTTTETTTESTTESTTTTTEATTEITTESTTVSESTAKTTTESTTTFESSTETTTIARRSSGGGGSSHSVGKTTTTTTESTTEAITEGNSEETTESVISNVVKVTIGVNKVAIGDKAYDVDVAPYIQEGSNSTLVPLRFVALAICGEDVENADTSKLIAWEAETKTAVITAGGKIIKFTAGSNVMIVDGKATVMDNGVKAEIKDGRMFIPFRALGEALGVDVDWDADTKTASYSMK